MSPLQIPVNAWFALPVSRWWQATVLAFRDWMDEVDSVWEPFLVDDGPAPRTESVR